MKDDNLNKCRTICLKAKDLLRNGLYFFAPPHSVVGKAGLGSWFFATVSPTDVTGVVLVSILSLFLKKGGGCNRRTPPLLVLKTLIEASTKWISRSLTLHTPPFGHSGILPPGIYRFCPSKVALQTDRDAFSV